MSAECSRRQMLLISVAGTAALGLAGCKGKSAALCHDSANADDKPLRESLAYVEASPEADKQCRHCAFFMGNENACGQCLIFNGPVNAGGHCTSWSRRSGA